MLVSILWVLFANVLVCVIWFWAWIVLAQKLLGVQVPRRKTLQYLALATGWQAPLATVLSYSTFLQYLFLELLNWDLIIFTVQAAILLLFVFRQQQATRAISAVALSYFFFSASIQPVNVWLEGWFLGLTERYSLSLWPARLLQVGSIVVYHLLGLIISLLVGRLLQKTNFSRYFASLFTSRPKAVCTCVVSVVLFQAPVIAVLLWPDASVVVQTVVFTLLALAMLFAVLFVAVFETNREKVKQQEAFIAQQQVYVQTLESLQQDLRSFRHDYQNLLSGLYLQASEGDSEAIQETLKSTIRYFDDRLGSQIHRVTELSRVEVPEVKSLLLVKLMQAEEARVPVQLEIPAPVTAIGMNHGDFLRCLGILADNAIEACAGVKGAMVRIALIQDEAGLLVVMANPVAQKPVLHQLEKPGYSTKGEGRGTGLASYKRLAGRYSNVITRTGYENGVFRQELRIKELVR